MRETPKFPLKHVTPGMFASPNWHARPRQSTVGHVQPLSPEQRVRPDHPLRAIAQSRSWLLAHGLIVEFERISVVHQPVQNVVGDGWIANLFVPGWRPATGCSTPWGWPSIPPPHPTNIRLPGLCRWHGHDRVNFQVPHLQELYYRLNDRLNCGAVSTILQPVQQIAPRRAGGVSNSGRPYAF